MPLLLISVLFIVIGILIKYGKMYFLISGYNTMSPEEKSKFNIEKIATLFRNVMFTMAAILIIGYILSLRLEYSFIELISIFVSVGIGVPYLLVKINSKSYRSKE